jgi:hypothetical protein
MTEVTAGAVPKVGDAVKVTDETGHQHDGLITAYFGGERFGAANVMFVSDDPTKTDPYGRQVERLSSTAHKSGTTAPGRFWE